MPYLSESEALKKGNNLLAFSAGVDSSALFFLLRKNNISFDIALVNYGLRKQSDLEEQYAIELAQTYNIKAYIHKAPLFQNNFEKNARDFRYDFFDTVMQENHYDNLITAHQLNDQLEWFLMRLSKGSGASELIGLTSRSKRKEYTLIRPILHHSKEELLNYLNKYNLKYFIDSSNYEEKYERNYFRKNFSDILIAKYRDGIKKSFEYLQEDKAILTEGYQEIFHHKEFYLLKIDNQNIKIRVIDKYLKKLGYLLSSGQRAEIKQSNSIVVAGLWAIETKDERIYIAPYITEAMPKRHKEQCRVTKIPPKIRGYLYREKIIPELLIGL